MMTHDAGTTDTTIKIANISDYPRLPPSRYDIIGRLQAAYFKMINEQGGVNGRKIEYNSYDSFHSLAKNDEVLFIVRSSTSSVGEQVYRVDSKKVPQLFIGASRASEGRIYGTYLIKNHPGEKIAVLHSFDDGLGGLEKRMGNKAPKFPSATTAKRTAQPSTC